MSSTTIPPARRSIRKTWVFVGSGLAAIIAVIVPAFCEVRQEATQTRRTTKLADLTLVVASETGDEWPLAGPQPDCQIPGPGSLAFFAAPADAQPVLSQRNDDGAATADTTFDPTWGNDTEPNWDMFEPQPVRKMPSQPALPSARRYAPVNPAHVSRWWAAKPEPRTERRPKRPLPIPAATRAVPLPSPSNPSPAVD